MEFSRQAELQPQTLNIVPQPTTPVISKSPRKKLVLILIVLTLIVVTVAGKYLLGQQVLVPNPAVVSPTPTISPTVEIFSSPIPSAAPVKIGSRVNIGYTESVKSWPQYKGGFYSLKYPKGWYVYKNGFVSPNKECNSCVGSAVGFDPQAKIILGLDKNLPLLDNAISYTVKNWGSTDLTEAFPLTIIFKSQNRIEAIWINSLPGEIGHDLLFFQSSEKDIYVLDLAGLYDIDENNKWVNKTYYGELLRKIFSTLEINHISTTPAQ